MAEDREPLSPSNSVELSSLSRYFRVLCELHQCLGSGLGLPALLI